MSQKYVKHHEGDRKVLLTRKAVVQECELTFAAQVVGARIGRIWEELHDKGKFENELWRIEVVRKKGT
jgi:hypothetical protein